MKKALDLSMDDALLLRQISLGDINSFEILFEKHWQWAYTEAYKRIKNTDDAKDIVQDVFAAIWNRRESISIQNFGAYLNVSIRNRVLKLLRKKSCEHPFFDALQQGEKTNDTADANLLGKELAESFQTVIKTLPPKRQEIFRLHYLQDLTTQDIASHLGISQKTVQNQLTRAMDTVKSSLSQLSLFFIVVVL